MATKKQFNFNDAFSVLENIVSDLEGDKLELEEALQKYETGLKIVGECKNKLDEVKNKVEVIKKKYLD